MNMMRMGLVDSFDGRKAVINFGETIQTCSVLVPSESFQMFPTIGDQVLVLFPYGDMTCGYVCGSISEQLTEKSSDLVIKTEGLAQLEGSKISLKTKSEDLIAILCEALQIIATSTTLVQGAPVPSLENQTHLPSIISRLRSMSS